MHSKIFIKNHFIVQLNLVKSGPLKGVGGRITNRSDLAHVQYFWGTILNLNLESRED